MLLVGAIHSIKIGKDNVDLSHLQFVDYTILFYPLDTDVLSNYRCLLDCFSVMSGLKINFQKSTLIPLNCDEAWVESIKDTLGCSISSLLIKYLGIPLDANPRRVETWRSVIDKIKKKLCGWKRKILLGAGRLTLVKSAINNLPIYYLGLFKMPNNVANEIIGLQRKFF